MSYLDAFYELGGMHDSLGNLVASVEFVAKGMNWQDRMNLRRELGYENGSFFYMPMATISHEDGKYWTPANINESAGPDSQEYLFEKLYGPGAL